MGDTKKAAIKSAFDLAMERMAQRGEGLVNLDDGQKKALADIGARAKAKIAEIEILFAKSLAQAQASNDAEKIAKVEEEKRTAIARVRATEEEERRRVRGA